MLTTDMINDANKMLTEWWGEAGVKVIDECTKVAPFNDTFDAFLNHCICCGGNWGGMLLTGIKALWPTVWEAIPNDMGPNAFCCICNTLILCGVDTTEEEPKHEATKVYPCDEDILGECPYAVPHCDTCEGTPVGK